MRINDNDEEKNCQTDIASRWQVWWRWWLGRGCQLERVIGVAWCLLFQEDNYDGFDDDFMMVTMMKIWELMMLIWHDMMLRIYDNDEEKDVCAGKSDWRCLLSIVSRYNLLIGHALPVTLHVCVAHHNAQCVKHNNSLRWALQFINSLPVTLHTWKTLVALAEPAWLWDSWGTK